MRPENWKTKIFLDSGDPRETKAALLTLGFLDGQTTNPSLIAKNPATSGKKFSKQELLQFYRGVVEEVSSLIPQGSVSIEVYADKNTTAEEMLAQGREFNTWIHNAHIKYPTTREGLKAAEISVKEGMRVNMTLVFSQEQAAAVYAATHGASRGQVFVSPFVGRLEDIGEKGMDLIKNILEMYKAGDGHVEVLTASVRSLLHIQEAANMGSDILTAPIKVLEEWHSATSQSPSDGVPPSPYEGREGERWKPIAYKDLDLNKPWQEYNIEHELTNKGLEKFASDWNNLIHY